MLVGVLIGGTFSLLIAAVTLPKQQVPCGLRISQAQWPALISEVMRWGMVHWPVA